MLVIGVKFKTFRIKFKKVLEKVKFVKVKLKGSFNVSQSVQSEDQSIVPSRWPISSILSTRCRLGYNAL